MPDSDTTPGQEASPLTPPPHLPSLDIALDLAREQLGSQLQHADSIDTKAGLILGSASLLTGILSVWQVPHILAHNVLLAKGLALLVFLVYAAVVFTAGKAYALQPYNRPPHPKRLNAYLAQPEQQTKGTVLSSIIQAYLANEKTLERKVCWTTRAFYALCVEVGVVGVVLFMQIMF